MCTCLCELLKRKGGREREGREGGREGEREGGRERERERKRGLMVCHCTLTGPVSLSNVLIRRLVGRR